MRMQSNFTIALQNIYVPILTNDLSSPFTILSAWIEYECNTLISVAVNDVNI